MRIVNITYPKALDENGNVIHISEVTQENRGDHTYWCLGCGKEMVPVLSQKREPHFRHKVNDICNRETYLHNLAKKELAKRFETQKKFEVSYYATNQCPRLEDCRLYKQYHFDDCNTVGSREKRYITIDLKEYYDTCEIEGTFGDFTADVLLKSCKDPKARPVFLEVLVTHACTPEKLNSGNRIIEIQIQREEDIYLPIKEITEEDIQQIRKNKQTIGYQRKTDGELPSTISFYGFKRGVLKDDLRKVDKYILLKDGRAGTLLGKVTCGEMDEKHFPDTLFEVIIPSEEQEKRKRYQKHLYSLGLAQSILRGLPVRHCYFCENFGPRCRVPVEYEERDYRTGQMKKVKRLVYVHRAKSEEFDHKAFAMQCPNWRADKERCKREEREFYKYGYLTWEPTKKEETK